MTVAEIFQLHAIKQRRQWAGNLHAVVSALDEQAIPDSSHPLVVSNLSTLQKHLASRGHPENDNFLLRYGLALPGISRGVRPPIDALQPERGGLSETRLAEASGQIERLQTALKLGRLAFNEPADDTATLLRNLWNSCRDLAQPDDAWVKAHSDLSREESATLVVKALRFARSADRNEADLGLGVLQAIADYRYEGLGEATEQLLEGGLVWEPELFRDAPDATGQRLLELRESSTGSDLLCVLWALAWTRGETAHQAFRQWKTLPPDWLVSLRRTPDHFTRNAGWTLGSTGELRDLIFQSCYRLEVPTHCEQSRFLVPCRQPTDQICDGCGSALFWLFDFSNLPDTLFPFDLRSAPRRVLGCHCCSCFFPFYGKYESDGSSRSHPLNKKPPTKQVDARPPALRNIATSPVSPFAARKPFGIIDASTLGGVPMWLQSHDYPSCPSCKYPMHFLAQFDNSSMPEREEGIFYSFFCGECRVSAVTYQQT